MFASRVRLVRFLRQLSTLPLVLAGLVSSALAQAPTAEFSALATSGAAPLFVDFTDQSTGSVSSWTWTFGDMAGSVLQDPLHAYLDPGTYTVSLTVAGPGGSDVETKVDFITVISTPVADFSAAPTIGFAPLPVSFTDLSMPAATAWSWDFGDGTGSSVQNPTHTYTEPGLYSVSLTAISALGFDVETKEELIQVMQVGTSVYRNGGGNPPAYVAPPPIVGTTWVAELDSSILPNALATVIFVRSKPADGPNTILGRVLVNLGSSDLATSIRPASGGIDQHSFPLPSTLSLIGRAGYSQGIVVGPMNTGLFYNAADLVGGVQPAVDPPEVDFSATPLSGDVPLSVSFSDLSTGVITAWTWDFGDGTTSSAESPTHTYTEGGSYPVSLVVEGPGGYDATIRSDFVLVTEPVAEFSGTPQVGVLPLPVSFTDESVGTITAWSWNFGDGGTSSEANPTYIYALEGTYSVSLSVTGPLGSSTEIKSDYVTVLSNVPASDFVGVPLSGETPLSVSFTSLSTGTVSGWSWDFGDGTGSSVHDPSHVYTLPGTYAVALTVSGPGGSDTETKNDYITAVPPPPDVDFSASTATSGIAPLTVDFRDLSSPSVTAWSWNFGDGGASTAQNPQYTYLIPGTYTVSLTVSDPTGSATATRPDYVVVGPQLPFALFEGQPRAGEVPHATLFSDISLGPVSSWSWDFGDGTTSTVQNPTHVYGAVGTYTVTLTIDGTLGPDTRIETDYIVTKPGPFMDGSFEQQTQGLPPEAPWDVDSGVEHVVQPDVAIPGDNGFPLGGTQWLEVSAEGSNAAVPPSNPGGLGDLPAGASGVSQAFEFVGETPVLVFGAAFVLGDEPSSVATNDFMSVDVSFAGQTYNIFYADTFSSFPATSSRYGLPMTEVEYVGVNLDEIFAPTASGPTFVLSIQVGNGGDGANPSLGFVDAFELRASAGVTYRNGSGVNPPCFVAPPPVIGASWMPFIDHRDYPGANFTVVLLRIGPIAPAPTAFGELLVDSKVIFDMPAVAAASGITSYSIGIAPDPSLFLSASAQGLILGTQSAFCNAIDVQLGLSPVDPVPQADFVVSAVAGSAPLSVVFADQSLGPVTSWNWDFGDGGTSTSQSPPHVYAAPGTYSVSLRATGPGGLDIERKLGFVQVTP